MGNSQSDQMLDSEQVHLKQFKLLRVVGKGAFGKVRIVERKDSGLHFALKYVSKEEIVRQENVRNIVRERKMLESLNHPFLCNLRYSFQDHEFVYLVVDLMTGGDLRFHIERKTFTEAAVRFWLAELGCALRYIHSQGIVHRDVKPDNVLLDSEGHVHLADFNVAANYDDPRRPLSSKSGTLAYVAPEAMAGKHYKSEVDWWALGVLFYECMYGRRPFNRKKNGPELEDLVMEAKPRYPITEPPVEPMCVGAMKRLLTKDISQRMGANGFHNFTQHPFFQVVDFNALEVKQIRPIFKPSADKVNFDATYDLEELLLEESPLEARAKYQRPRAALKADASESDKRAEILHQMIEKDFEPFDYQKAHYKRLPVANPTETLPTDSGAKVRPTLQTQTPTHPPSSSSSSNPPPRPSQPSNADPDPVAIAAALPPQATSTDPSSFNSTAHAPPSTTTATTAITTNPTPPPPAQTRRAPPDQRATPLRATIAPTPPPLQHRSKSVSGFRAGRSSDAASSAAASSSSGSRAAGSPSWADVTPKKPAASADEPGRGRKKTGAAPGSGGGGMFGFMAKRKASARQLEGMREAGILGKVGARVVVAEDGGSSRWWLVCMHQRWRRGHLAALFLFFYSFHRRRASAVVDGI
ncbi:hypothetical protein FH972_023423 [Carpinus fangiana]|uniref:Protein kinase domain-containing protein n=1 Tax=Carpinus fangiana TaxID=176857 RepID=A0A5N6KVH3_9ROSI|nr:hypothetical protein FH972_023423 [Carpinus fangiana]